MFGPDLRKKGVCSKSTTKTLIRSKFWVTECDFELVCHCELQVGRDWLCVRDIAETSLNRSFLFLILKAATGVVLQKKVFLKILEENTFAGASF